MDDARESREEKHFFGRGLIAAPVDSMYTPNTISGTDRHLFLSQIFFFLFLLVVVGFAGSIRLNRRMSLDEQ